MEPIRITIPSDPSNIAIVRIAVEAFGVRNGFSREQTDHIGLAVNEALANVIKHAYHGNMTQLIHVSMAIVNGQDQGDRTLKLVIRDFGKQVDPECIKSRDLEEIRPGGLGVHIMRTVMDDVSYRCLPEGGMELTLLKYVKSAREVGK